MDAASASPALDRRPTSSQARGGAGLRVGGVVTIAVALVILAGGAAALWGLGERDSDDFFTTGPHRLSTTSYAITSSDLDAGYDIPGWLEHRLATLRIDVRSPNRVFVGIARTEDVQRYLSGVGRSEITDLETDPFSVNYRHHTGGSARALPATRTFWRTRTVGRGRQTLDWPLEEGHWSAIAMNADGSRGVSMQATLGARVGAAAWATVGLLAAGAVLLVAGAALLVLGRARR